MKDQIGELPWDALKTNVNLGTDHRAIRIPSRHTAHAWAAESISKMWTSKRLEWRLQHIDQQFDRRDIRRIHRRSHHNAGQAVMVRDDLIEESLHREAQFSPAVAEPSPCLTFGPTFVTLRPWKRTLSASDSGPKAISYQ